MMYALELILALDDGAFLSFPPLSRRVAARQPFINPLSVPKIATL